MIVLFAFVVFFSSCHTCKTACNTSSQVGQQAQKYALTEEDWAQLWNTREGWLIALMVRSPEELIGSLKNHVLLSQLYALFMGSDVTDFCTFEDIGLLRLTMFIFLHKEERDKLIMEVGKKIMHPSFDYPELGLKKFLQKIISGGGCSLNLDEPLTEEGKQTWERFLGYLDALREAWIEVELD